MDVNLQLECMRPEGIAGSDLVYLKKVKSKVWSDLVVDNKGRRCVNILWVGLWTSNGFRG